LPRRLRRNVPDYLINKNRKEGGSRIFLGGVGKGDL